MCQNRHYTPLGEGSEWVSRFAALVPAGRPVLDVACGGGRHSLLFLERGHPVTAIDRDIDQLESALEGAKSADVPSAVPGIVRALPPVHRPARRTSTDPSHELL